MATLTLDAEGPGKAGSKQLLAFAPRTMKIVTGTFSFDSSYPTGGESVSDLTGLFRSCLGILVENPSLSAGTGKAVVVDLSGSKLKLVTNAATPAEVANASDQSGATGLHFIAWGY